MGCDGPKNVSTELGLAVPMVKWPGSEWGAASAGEGRVGWGLGGIVRVRGGGSS
jgi:hypothetical protein